MSRRVRERRAGPANGVRNVRNFTKRSKLEYARHMRRNPTPAERLLWSRLRANQLGFKFRHQAIIRGWIVDFWCPLVRLVVEVDGRGHAAEAQRLRDIRRTTAMAELGITTIRFWNEEVLGETDKVCDLIFRAALVAGASPLIEARKRRSRGTGASLKDRRQRREAACVGQAAMSRSPEAPSGANTSLPIGSTNGLGTRRRRPACCEQPRRPSENGEGGTCS